MKYTPQSIEAIDELANILLVINKGNFEDAIRKAVTHFFDAAVEQAYGDLCEAMHHCGEDLI